MNAFKRWIITAFAGLCALAPAHSQNLIEWLFPPPQVQGTVGYVQANHFMLVSKDNQFLRIYLQPNQAMPPTIVPGMFVVARVRNAQDQMKNSVVVLDRVEAVQGPTGVTPVVNTRR